MGQDEGRYCSVITPERLALFLFRRPYVGQQKYCEILYSAEREDGGLTASRTSRREHPELAGLRAAIRGLGERTWRGRTRAADFTL